MKKSTTLLLGFIAILGVLVYALRDKLGLGNKGFSSDNMLDSNLNTNSGIGNSDERSYQLMRRAFMSGFTNSSEANNTLGWMMPYFEENMLYGVNDSSVIVNGKQSKSGTFLYTISQLAFNPSGKYIVNGSNSVVPPKVFTDMWNIFNELKVASF